MERVFLQEKPRLSEEKSTTKSSNESEPVKSNKSKDPAPAALWKKIEGKFTYELVDPKTKSRYVCRAKSVVTDQRLTLELILEILIRKTPLKAGETLEFKMIDPSFDPEIIRVMIKNKAWLPESKAAVMGIMTGRALDINELTELLDMLSLKKRVPAPKGICPQCYGSGWVCEEHAHVPFECPCMAPGMACEACNEEEAIRLGPGDFVIGPDSCPRCYDRRWLCAKHDKPWSLPDFGCSCAIGKPCPECNRYGQLKPGEQTSPGIGLN